jgi:sulfur carrier protein
MSAAPVSISITINGAAHEISAGTTVADVVAIAAPSPKGIAVAVNAEVVPRSGWGTTAVVDGDRVELLTAAQGG